MSAYITDWPPEGVEELNTFDAPVPKLTVVPAIGLPPEQVVPEVPTQKVSDSCTFALVVIWLAVDTAMAPKSISLPAFNTVSLE